MAPPRDIVHEHYSGSTQLYSVEVQLLERSSAPLQSSLHTPVHGATTVHKPPTVSHPPYQDRPRSQPTPLVASIASPPHQTYYRVRRPVQVDGQRASVFAGSDSPANRLVAPRPPEQAGRH